MSATLIAYNINIETAQNRIRITYKRSVAVCALLLFLPIHIDGTYSESASPDINTGDGYDITFQKFPPNSFSLTLT